MAAVPLSLGSCVLCVVPNINLAAQLRASLSSPKTIHSHQSSVSNGAATGLVQETSHQLWSRSQSQWRPFLLAHPQAVTVACKPSHKFPGLLGAIPPSTEKPCLKAIGTHLYWRFYRDTEDRTYTTHSITNNLEPSFTLSAFSQNPSSAGLLLHHFFFLSSSTQNAWLSNSSLLLPKFHSKSQVSLPAIMQRGDSMLPGSYPKSA